MCWCLGLSSCSERLFEEFVLHLFRSQTLSVRNVFLEVPMMNSDYLAVKRLKALFVLDLIFYFAFDFVHELDRNRVLALVLASIPIFQGCSLNYLTRGKNLISEQKSTS